MRDGEYRRKQEKKKSYKKFVGEMKHDKFKNPVKGGKSRNINLNKIDYENLSEEEIRELEDLINED